MPEFFTPEGDIRVDDREDTLFTSGLTMMMINNNNNNFRFNSGGSNSGNSFVSEIEEIFEQEDTNDDDNQRNWINNDRSSFNIRNRIPATIKELEFEGMSNVSSSYDPNNIYVAVGKSGSSSMDALRWTLENLVNSPSNFIYLIHIFPEIRLIPSPLGMLPKEKVGQQQVESYIRQQNVKRNESLEKYMHLCSVYKVKVDTLLVESDNTAKAVLDLILILNIKRIVMGTTKSGLRKLRRRNGIGGQIVKNASDTCDIKIICEGKQVTAEQILSFSVTSPRHSSSSSNTTNESITIDQITEKKTKDIGGHGRNGEDDNNEPVGRSVSSPSCACFPTRF